ncbi:PhzF family phenazine biosynthesis protein [Bordetella holmesii]|nr:PhzF family phenazine biosynthesis protein [Bordetella holmesii]AMD47400.1 PhzF family phenazine biosynthesis protein [Bordetella holmesii H558]AOB37328.1 PhzF family phenazine biosynthesis protein [Bordetella holmesii]AUL21283.1 PhzF family phenazine biosynthesis protein [Bordetella holmesii]AUL24611.1 PhzF family phenazine biosynthesis protein [Bordetella holmesii]AUL27952.1 PhzF family phenazine biosynthesis protein [Bordetella holmesii]
MQTSSFQPTAQERIHGYSVQRLSAFAAGDTGGNPAGVVISEHLPDAATMQAIAADVGYSETAFAAPEAGVWRVRYFAPEIEIPFCGHATIALGAALAARHGEGRYALQINDALISVQAHRHDGQLQVALQSPPTRSQPAEAELIEASLQLFGYTHDDLDPRLPPALAQGGAHHLILALNNRQRLTGMRYDQSAGRQLMLAQGFATIAIVYAETAQRFHARNPFASGGVYEDPATGAAAAALGGYLRDQQWPHGGAIDIIQGEDMGMPSYLHAEISPETGGSIRVSGTVRSLAG